MSLGFSYTPKDIIILIMWIIHVPIHFNKSQNDKITVIHLQFWAKGPGTLCFPYQWA